jgi:hypothetical protein
MGDRESVRFDRAAEFYDETRAHSEDLALATTELLASELRGRGRILEIGVGTGLIALPLDRVGIPMGGLDLSAPMVGKLVEKAGGRPPFRSSSAMPRRSHTATARSEARSCGGCSISSPRGGMRSRSSSGWSSRAG